jgi:hypothetical protein
MLLAERVHQLVEKKQFRVVHHLADRCKVGVKKVFGEGWIEGKVV